jgi:hypothetical protein
MLQVGMLLLLMTMYPADSTLPLDISGDPLLAPPPAGSTACQETPIVASPWQDMQRQSDAVLCTTTFVPE